VQLDLTTFVLEVVNFLVLVWILRHFFFRPISSAIDKRRKATQAILDEARKKEEAALTLKTQYEARISEWGSERDKARHALDQELSKVRATQLDKLRVEMRTEQERLEAQQSQQQRQTEFRHQRQALALAMKFTSRLLSRIASPAVESQLIDAAREDMSKIGVKANLVPTNGTDHAVIRVLSAYPLTETKRAEIRETVSNLLGTQPSIEFATDNSLIAGIRILLGAHVIDANLARELRFFAEGFADDTAS